MTHGSEKQIAWAEKIKSAAKNHLAVAEEVAAGMMDPKGHEMLKSAINAIRQCEDAIWWIDNRDMFACHADNLRDCYKYQVRNIVEAGYKIATK